METNSGIMAQNRREEIREYYEFHLTLIRETIDLITELLTTETTVEEITYMNALRRTLERDYMHFRMEMIIKLAIYDNN